MIKCHQLEDIDRKKTKRYVNGGKRCILEKADNGGLSFGCFSAIWLMRWGVRDWLLLVSDIVKFLVGGFRLLVTHWHQLWSSGVRSILFCTIAFSCVGYGKRGPIWSIYQTTLSWLVHSRPKPFYIDATWPGDCLLESFARCTINFAQNYSP